MNQLSPNSAPRQGHFICWAAGFTLFALYGSLVPLRIQPLSFHDAVEQYRTVVTSPLDFNDRSDWVSNILLFMPIGFFWMAVLCEWPSGFRALFVAVPLVLVCARSPQASSSCNCGYRRASLLARRHRRRNDRRGDGAGTLAAARIGADRMAARYFSAGRPKQHLDSLLQAYFVGFAIYAVMPLDVTISPNELAGKYRRGVMLVPSAGWPGM